MGVKILDQSYTTRDFVIIAVCMAHYLNSKGVDNDNYNVVRILRAVLTKLPEKVIENLTKMFNLNNHLDFDYKNTIENNNSDIVDKFYN